MDMEISPGNAYLFPLIVLMIGVVGSSLNTLLATDGPVRQQGLSCEPSLTHANSLQAGKFQRPRGTPLKRLRSPESRMQTDSLLSPTRDRVEDSALDIRTHKRFLSEAGSLPPPLCLLANT